jgi:hypothetical protein
MPTTQSTARSFEPEGSDFAFRYLERAVLISSRNALFIVDFILKAE